MMRLAAPLLLLAFVACAPPTVPASAPVPAPLPTRGAAPMKGAPAPHVSGKDASTANALSRSILQGVKAARARAGSQALLLDSALQHAPGRSAAELASRGELDHASATPGLRTVRNLAWQDAPTSEPEPWWRVI